MTKKQDKSAPSETIRGFHVGSTAEIEHLITAEDIQKFVEMTGDDNPIHLDRKFAEKTHFKGIIAHGMLGASFLSTIIGKHIPGKGALWLSQTIEFLLPVRIGDRLKIRAEVTQVNVRQQLLHLKMEILNQYQQLILKGESKVKALKFEEAEEKPVAISKNHTVIITGASRGIGAATALMLAEQKHRVVICYRNDEEGATSVAKKIKTMGSEVLCVKADMANAQDIRRLVSVTVDRFGEISALVNNATPKIIYKPFLNTSVEEFRAHLEVTFFGPLQLIRESLPFLEKSRRGVVINLGTIATDNVPPAHLSAYTTAKAALVHLTKSLAQEFGPKGIRFNVVSPGMTETSLIADTPEKARMLFKMRAPLQRLAQPEDIAQGIAYLLSEAASYITGETLHICGGTVMV